MGAYTSIVDSNVKIINLSGLKKFLKDLMDEKDPRYINTQSGWTDTGQNRGPEYANAVSIEKLGDVYYLDFSGMDGWKIISYWYDSMVLFFRDIGVFVEGEIQMEFETQDESGWIEFKQGKTIFHTGQMEWQTWGAEEVRPNIPPLSDELKSILVLRQI